MNCTRVYRYGNRRESDFYPDPCGWTLRAHDRRRMKIAGVACDIVLYLGKQRGKNVIERTFCETHERRDAHLDRARSVLERDNKPTCGKCGRSINVIRSFVVRDVCTCTLTKRLFPTWAGRGDSIELKARFDKIVTMTIHVPDPSRPNRRLLVSRVQKTEFRWILRFDKCEHGWRHNETPS